MDKTILRRWKSDGDLIAFFPEYDANPGMVVSYMHVGQHSEAAYHMLLGLTTPVKDTTAKDVQELLAELRRIGYNPVLYRRMQRRA